MKMRKGFLISVSVVVLVAMFPLTALACHIENWNAKADCTGFTLYVKYEGTGTVKVTWTVQLYDENNQPVEEHSDWSAEFGPSNPWTYSQKWSTNLVGDSYRAEVSMEAVRVSGGSLGGTTTYTPTINFGPCPCDCLYPIDFEVDENFDPLDPGDVVHDQWLSSWGMRVTTSDPSGHPAMIFGSSNPTCGDDDLGSPNEAWCADGGGVPSGDSSCTAGPGPGKGSGGTATNKKDLGNILIINERPAGQVCDVGDGVPDDDNTGMRTLTFTFEEPQPIWTLQLLDMRSGATVRAYDAKTGGNQVIGQVDVPGLGSNGYQTLELNARGVQRLEISMQLGAVAGIWFCEPGTPTAVELASFEAAAQGNAITLAWETATELDNLGFNLYRAGAADGPRAQLNASLIASQNPGSPVGASYQFVDASAASGLTYYYWLEAVDVNGGAALHGPISAELAPLSRLLPARPRLVAGPPRLGSR